jgi:hypothetical protein
MTIAPDCPCGAIQPHRTPENGKEIFVYARPISRPRRAITDRLHIGRRMRSRPDPGQPKASRLAPVDGWHPRTSRGRKRRRLRPRDPPSHETSRTSCGAGTQRICPRRERVNDSWKPNSSSQVYAAWKSSAFTPGKMLRRGRQSHGWFEPGTTQASSAIAP